MNGMPGWIACETCNLCWCARQQMNHSPSPLYGVIHTFLPQWSYPHIPAARRAIPVTFESCRTPSSSTPPRTSSWRIHLGVWGRCRKGIASMQDLARRADQYIQCCNRRHASGYKVSGSVGLSLEQICLPLFANPRRFV